MRVLFVEPGKAARPVEMKNDLHEMQQMVADPFRHFIRGKNRLLLSAMTKENMGLPLNRVLENYDIIAGAFFLSVVFRGKLLQPD